MPGLPAQPTPLIGRDTDIAHACARLAEPDVRLLTLLGPPGVGKTRLALAVAERLAPTYERGAVFVDLAPLADAALVGATLARALGISQTPSQPVLDTLKYGIGDRRLLLLLDNLEHLPDATPDVAALLTACPNLRILATSRAPLRLRWEHVLDVPPLAPLDAAALFRDRARAAGAALERLEQTTLDAICARLDRLPLAIELAAPHTRSIPADALLARLDRGLETLTDGPRDLPARQRTLRDAIAWSYDLLAPPEQALFRRLSVFPAGCTEEAAAALVSSDDSAPRRQLAALLEVSLLRPATGPDGTVRYRMLETVREFAGDRLHAEDDPAAARRAGTAYLLQLAEGAEPHLKSGRRAPWLVRLDAELDNIRAALAWCTHDPDSLDTGFRLTASLEWYWYFRDHWREGFERTEALLGAEWRGAPSAARTKAICTSGRLAVFLGAFPIARARLQAAATHFEQQASHRDLAYAHVHLARLHTYIGRPDDHRDAALRATLLFRAEGDRWGLGLALYYLADAQQTLGALAEARAMAEESIALFKALQDPWAATLASDTLASTLISLGDLTTASRVVDEALDARRVQGGKFALASSLLMSAHIARLGGKLDESDAAYNEVAALPQQSGIVAAALRGRAFNAIERGEPGQAARFLGECLSLTAEYPDMLFVAHALVAAAALSLSIGRVETAARLLGASAHLLPAGSVLGPIPSIDFDAVARRARKALDGTDFTRTFADGMSLSRQGALSLALESVSAAAEAEHCEPAVAEPRRRASGRRISQAGLTRREAEILDLLAHGRSNREIAADLVVSIRTVEHHIARLYAKIGAHRRADAAAYAVHHGLVQLDRRRT
jgi:predicted ATPase/DNA-binding CsgD family transcriptional regulator